MKFLLSCYVCVFISINTNMFSQNIKTVTIKDITLQKGRSLATLKLENNLGVEVNLSVPEISKEKKLPLIIESATPSKIDVRQSSGCSQTTNW